MKANELRLGNLVLNHKNEIIPVGYDDITKLIIWETIGYGKRPHLKPLPLTEKEINKFNFEKTSSGYPCFCGERFVIVQMSNAYTLFLNLIEGLPNNMELIRGFEYVHELQNLYFDLTGKQLN